METKMINRLKEAMEASQKHHSKILDGDFDKWCEISHQIEEPLAAWAQGVMEEVLPSKGLSTWPDILARVKDNDMNCREVSIQESSILYKDDEHEVSAVLDYDCDTVLIKYSVEDKLNSIEFSSAYDAGEIEGAWDGAIGIEILD